MIQSSMKRILLLTLFLLPLLFSSHSQAKVFRNSYVSFKLPTGWDCYLENTAWICRYSVPSSCTKSKMKTKDCRKKKKKTKEAIIILTAKEKGGKDSLRSYKRHLEAPRPILTRKKARAKSKVIHSKSVAIGKGKQKWVDGMHLSSEIPHYYTRYLATIKGNIAVLVTFSAHKLYYSKYSKAFFQAIKSLEVVASRADTARVGGPGNNSITDRPIGQSISGDEFLGPEGEEDESENGDDSSDSNLLFIIAAVLAALGVFFWIKGR